jgi:6-phospho-beta-glucosidase
LLADRALTRVVNGRNDGTLRGLAADDVVEMPFRIGGGGLRPVAAAPLPPDMLGLVQAVTAYERLTVDAALTGDRTIARRALMAHPLVGQWTLAGDVLDDLLDVGRRHLPRFWP